MLKICLLFISMMCCQVSMAQQDWTKWQSYENQYFRIHSDARSKNVLELLEELDSFRLVVERALKVKRPANADKTDKLLFKKSKEFERLAGSRRVGGFVTYVDAKPTIVMPIFKRGGAFRTVIKHKYVHVVQAYDPGVYPRWWNEGLAEVLSMVTYHENLAIVGKPTKRTWNMLQRHLNYDDVVDEQYDHLKLRSGADTYAHFWLLANHTLTHENGFYLDNLAKHITGFRETGDALQSFIAGYGRTPGEFASEAMKNYRRRSYSYQNLRYLIDLAERDLSPSIGPVDRLKMQRLVAEIAKRRRYQSEIRID